MQPVRPLWASDGPVIGIVHLSEQAVALISTAPVFVGNPVNDRSRSKAKARGSPSGGVDVIQSGRADDASAGR
jgi:hypothetical protein